MVASFTSQCDPGEAAAIGTDGSGISSYHRATTRFDVLPRGCLTTRLVTPPEREAGLAAEIPQLLDFRTRLDLERTLDQRSDGRLHLDPAPGRAQPPRSAVALGAWPGVPHVSASEAAAVCLCTVSPLGRFDGGALPPFSRVETCRTAQSRLRAHDGHRPYHGGIPTGERPWSRVSAGCDPGRHRGPTAHPR